MAPLLGYWKIRGLVQPVRLLLAYTNTEFEEKHYEIGPDLSRDSWLQDKFNLGLELPNLPFWLESDEVKLTQSRAILRHIARERDPDLLGRTNEEQRRLDMLENHMWDFWMALVHLCFRYTETDKENFLQSLPKQLDLLSAFFKDHKWAVSDNITYVDFLVYEALYQHKVFAPDCLNNYPKLNNYIAEFESLEKIEEYMVSPRYIEKPLYTRLAKHYI